MIKRITFAEPIDSTAAPSDCRPSRVTVSRVLADVTPHAPHDVIGLEWFDDDAHLGRFESWLAEAGAEVSRGVIADEHVLRGEDWLTQRWADGEPALKHMALARRAEGLTPAQFLERWASRAGSVGRDGATVAIPAEARGSAYVQNRPCARDAGEWAYDAVNEVYLEDLASLQQRIAWFDEHLRDDADADLVGAHWFVAATEQVVYPYKY